MDDANPSRAGGAARLWDSELTVRIISAAVLAPVAVLIAYVGGFTFQTFWGLAAIVVVWEWTLLVTETRRNAVLVTALTSVTLALILTGISPNRGGPVAQSHLLAGIAMLAAGMVVAAAVAPPSLRAWVAAGIPYAAGIGLSPIILRSDTGAGFLALVFLFAIVWATDIAAFFAGRAIGGPKLAPRISPNKTWSGAVGGVLGGAGAAIVVAMLAGLGGLLVITSIAVVLSMVAQAGDLFESALKRRFGVKDSGRLIPGHGGLMDRLDGFVAAAVVACLFGVARGGLDAPARGLLIW
jgi:phosphatidate cytidylyltransferase